MADVYEVTGKVVKVSVGPANGNQVAHMLRAGAVVPPGVPEEDLKRLVARKLIRKARATRAAAAKTDDDPKTDPDSTQEETAETDPEPEETPAEKPAATTGKTAGKK